MAALCRDAATGRIEPHATLQASGFRFQVSGFRFPVSGFRSQASGLILWIVAALCRDAATGQTPLPTITPLPQVWYFAAMATDGTNSALTSGVAWTNPPCVLAWSNSPANPPGTHTLILAGRRSGRYSVTNDVGTDTSTPWPVTPWVQPPAMVTAAIGSNVFWQATNPPGCRFLREEPITATNWTAIADATDPAGPWTNAFAFVPGIGRLTMTIQTLKN